MPAVLATAVAIAGEALVIRGPSRAGKSRLAVALVACSTRRRPIILVGDDRVVLTRRADALIAAPHPRLAGFLERRGLGIVAMPWINAARVGGCVDLGDAAPEALLAEMPRLAIAAPCETETAAARVLTWWASRAACASHLPRKAAAAIR